MFNTSDRFKEVIRGTSEQYLTGIITATDGTVIEINDSVISSGSVSITKQCLTGQEFAYGAAVIGELDMSIRTNLSRYLMYDAEIDLWCRVVVDNESEHIPLGIWTIAEAERDKQALKVVAYDNLIKLNRKYDLALEGTPYELMNAFALVCDCELAEDETYYASLTNSDHYITINSEAGCSTFRDAASIVAQVCGCFIQADRYGRISMRQFSTEPTFSITRGQRYGSTISDFVCHYIELEVSGRNGTFISINEESDVGMKMLIEDAPAWDYGLPETLQQRADNLRWLLEELYYTPCEISVPSDPSIDCGDMVTLYMEDGSAGDESVNSLITSYTWQYRGAMELSSSGVNPYLQTSDANSSRQLRDLREEIDAAKVIYYPFMNTSRTKLTTTAQRIVSVPFTSIDDTSVIFQGTLQLDVESPDVEEIQTLTLTIPATEQSEAQTVEVPITTHRPSFANLTLFYHFDNVKQRIVYTNALNSGGHTISLFYPVNQIESNTTHTFEVWASIEDGEATIDTGMFIGAISGQGLAAISQWNGQLELDDYIEPVQRVIPFRMARPMEAEVITEGNDMYTHSMFTEHFARTASSPAITMRTFEVSNGNDLLDLIVRQQTVVFNTGDNKHISVNRGETKLRTSYVFDGEVIEIDEGTAVSAYVELDVKSVESVVTSSDNH